MSHARGSISWLLTAAIALAISGCGSPAGQGQPKGTSPDKAAEASNDSEKAMPPEATEVDLSGLAELSGEDRAAAEKQRICPVSGALLGSMRKPCKVTVKGQTVFLCCSGCEEELQKDPDKYLAKLKAAEKKAEKK